MSSTLKEFIAYVACTRKHAEGIIAGFRKQIVGQDVGEVLSCSDEIFRQAAALRICNFLEPCFMHEDIEGIRKIVQNNLLVRTRFPAQSTSVTANLLSLYTAAAWADFAAELSI